MTVMSRDSGALPHRGEGGHQLGVEPAGLGGGQVAVLLREGDEGAGDLLLTLLLPLHQFTASATEEAGDPLTLSQEVLLPHPPGLGGANRVIFSQAVLRS